MQTHAYHARSQVRTAHSALCPRSRTRISRRRNHTSSVVKVIKRLQVDVSVHLHYCTGESVFASFVGSFILDRDVAACRTLVAPPNSVRDLLVFSLLECRLVVLRTLTHALLDDIHSYKSWLRLQQAHVRRRDGDITHPCRACLRFVRLSYRLRESYSSGP